MDYFNNLKIILNKLINKTYTVTSLFFYFIVKKIIQHKTLILFLVVITLATALHSFNMFGYPYYESDEGTYTSQAWSIVTQGKLSPYTYWYDHPPLGWVLIASWFYLLPDGVFSFGTSIDTARVLMLLLHIGSTSLIYFIVKKITKSDIAAFTATFLYIITPLGIYFHRRVLLDNILNFWILASVAILFKQRLTLREYALSGIFYALAFLTKITTAMFGPAILLLVIVLKNKTHKTFRTATWLAVSISIVFIYILFSLLKKEFFPALWSGSQHVSLIESISFQMNRGTDLLFFQKGSDFMLVLQDWSNRDMFFMSLATFTLVAGIIISIKTKDLYVRFFTLSSLLYLLFLIRGGIVINLYVIPILPFICILFVLTIRKLADFLYNITLNTQYFRKKFSKLSFINKEKFITIISSLLILFIIFFYSFSSEKIYLTKNETKNQIAAVTWIKESLPVQSDIVIDSIMYVELHDPNFINTKVFENAEWFYKVSRDPEIRINKYNDNWKTLDYVAITHEMLKQIDKFDPSDIVHAAFNNSLPIAKWFEGSSSYIDEQKLITTNGDWSMVYQINGTTKSQLVDSWNAYKKNFIVSYGQTIDKTNNDITTSEGQSYAMLRSAWMNDKETFNGSWLWTQHHLQHRLDDKLISWKWGDNKLIDSANATDADQDIALALLFGSKIFVDDSYIEDAKEIIRDLWKFSVIEIDGIYYMLSANKSQSQVPEGLLFNPSYMSPAHYRIFAEVDPENDWNKLADDVYKILDKISSDNVTGLPSNWYVLDRNTGNLSSASNHIIGANNYSYDAFRILWRVWLDYSWYANRDAENYLKRIGSFLNTKTNGLVQLPTIYNPANGATLSWEDSIAIQSGYVLALATLDNKEKSIDYYKEFVADRYNEEDGHWGSEEVYYDQNWVWFISAVYNNDVYNLWEYFN